MAIRALTERSTLSYKEKTPAWPLNVTVIIGSEEYALADQARQRELERLGWTFVRVFESNFYLDKNEQVERIVQRLDELEIHPWSGSEGADHDAESNVEVVETVFDDEEDSHDSSSSEVVFSTSLADPQIQPAETPSAE